MSRPSWIPPWWGWGSVVLLLILAMLIGPISVCMQSRWDCV